MLHLFLDTADIDKIRDCYSLITLDGVTTNPSLIASAKNKYGSPVLALKVIYKFVKDHDGILQVQPVGTSYEEIIEDSYFILEEVGDDVCLKIPVSEPGLAAIGKLSKEGANVTAASVYSFTQGMLAYKAGAKTVSVYCNRAEEKGIDYESVIRSIKNAFPNDPLLAASFKDTKQVEKATLAGADSVTIKPSLLYSDLNTDLVKETVESFKFSYQSAFNKENMRS